MTAQDYLKKWIEETYPLMDYDDYEELDYHDMQKFAVWIVKLLDAPAVSKSEGIEHEPTVCCETCKYYPPIGLNKVPCNNCIEDDKWQQAVC